MGRPVIVDATLATLANLAEALTRSSREQPALLAALAERWDRGAANELAALLGDEGAELALAARDLLRDGSERADLSAALGAADAPTLVRLLLWSWARSAALRHDAWFAPMLFCAKDRGDARAASIEAARERVRNGPLIDALECLPWAGDGAWLRADPADRARVDLLIWEAGAQARQMPDLGRWLWSDAAAFDALLLEPARDHLRGRVSAARLLSIAADGCPSRPPDRSLLVRTTKLVGSLARHPEPMVWIPGVRAVGRLVAHVPGVRALQLQWAHSEHAGEVRRATAAYACMPAAGGALDRTLRALFEQQRDVWQLAALGPAIPYLAVERPALWEKLVRTLVAPRRRGRRKPKPPPIEVLWSMALGLETLVRRGSLDRASDELLAAVRDAARSLEVSSASVGALCYDIALVCGADAVVSHRESELDQLVARSLTQEAEPAARDALEIAEALGSTFRSALKNAASGSEAGRRGRWLRVLEGSTRAMATRLWEPLCDVAGIDRNDASESVAHAAERIGSQLRAQLAAAEPDFDLHRSLLRCAGHLVDRTSAPRSDEISSERGRAASLLLEIVSAAPWLTRPSRRDEARFRKAAGDALWRIPDSVRRAVAPLEHDEALLRRLAAWWALRSRGDDALWSFLSRAEALVRDDVAADLPGRIAAVRGAVATDGSGDGEWAGQLLALISELGAGDTLMSHALLELAGALEALPPAERGAPNDVELRRLLGPLLQATVRWRAVMANPELALSMPAAAETIVADDATLVARTRDLSRRASHPPEPLIRAWSEGLGAVVSPVVAHTMERVLHAWKRRGTDKPWIVRGDYEKLHMLGKSNYEVWVVEDPHRVWRVLKEPGLGFAKLGEMHRREIIDNLVRDAEALKRVSHPNVALFIDAQALGESFYLVTAFHTGIDMDSYVEVRPMTLSELDPVVVDTCRGLRALHDRGIIHCDLKPGNVLLQIHLSDPNGMLRTGFAQLAREMEVQSAILIDFGIAQTLGHPDPDRPDVFGTPGYMPPEQIDPKVGPVSPASDVYGLAATVYHAFTGKPFFHDVRGMGILGAHLVRDPLETPTDVPVPDSLRALLEDATRREPKARPSVEEFQRRFRQIR